MRYRSWPAGLAAAATEIAGSSDGLGVVLGVAVTMAVFRDVGLRGGRVDRGDGVCDGAGTGGGGVSSATTTFAATGGGVCSVIDTSDILRGKTGRWIVVIASSRCFC